MDDTMATLAGDAEQPTVPVGMNNHLTVNVNQPVMMGM